MTEITQNATDTKTTKGKPAKKAAKTKATTIKAKAAKPKPEKTLKEPREDRTGWGTFALKMPIAERESFHKAAGTASASRFARIVLLAFAYGDETAFRNAISEAKRLQA